MAAASVTVAHVDGVSLVAPCGALCAAAVAQVQPCLAPLLTRQPPILVIDLSHVPDCDRAGLRLLALTAQIAADHGGQVRLAAPTPAVGRALRHAGIPDIMPIFGSITGAVCRDTRDLLLIPTRSGHARPPGRPPATALSPVNCRPWVYRYHAARTIRSGRDRRWTGRRAPRGVACHEHGSAANFVVG